MCMEELEHSSLVKSPVNQLNSRICQTAGGLKMAKLTHVAMGTPKFLSAIYGVVLY